MHLRTHEWDFWVSRGMRRTPKDGKSISLNVLLATLGRQNAQMTMAKFISNSLHLTQGINQFTKRWIFFDIHFSIYSFWILYWLGCWSVNHTGSLCAIVMEISNTSSRSSALQLDLYMVPERDNGVFCWNQLPIHAISMILDPISNLPIHSLYRSPNQECSEANTEICHSRSSKPSFQDPLKFKIFDSLKNSVKQEKRLPLIQIYIYTKALRLFHWIPW